MDANARHSSCDGGRGTTTVHHEGQSRERRSSKVNWKEEEVEAIVEVCCSPDSVIARGKAAPPVLQLPEAYELRIDVISRLARSSMFVIVCGLCAGLVLTKAGLLGVVVGVLIFLTNARTLLKVGAPA